MTWTRHVASWALGLGLIEAAASCSGKPIKAGGLEVVIMATDGLTASSFDSIEVEVEQELSTDNWHRLLHVTPRIPDEMRLPMWVSIQAGEQSSQNALIHVTAFKNAMPVIARTAQVQLPTNRVAQLQLLLSKQCIGRVTDACADGSCDPATGVCGGSIVVEPKGLTAYSGPDQTLDAGVLACAGGDCAEPPSCREHGPGKSNCGPENESCCTSPLVTGGAYYRDYDGVTYTSQNNPATVSDYRLDKYEITVGRFRRFVTAWNQGWRPGAGAGKHLHLNGANGLVDSSGTTGYETGWDTAWEANVEPTDAHLKCGTWTPAAGGNENLPISCENWWEAYAFCIWDGGFLPSGTEWNYAAGGGDEQRVYPWSNPPSSTTIDCSYANYGGPSWPSTACVPQLFANVGSFSPKGDSRYGQGDLSGNVWEWALDWSGPYGRACADCSYLPSSADWRQAWGGCMANNESSIVTSRTNPPPPSHRSYEYGARCARSP